MFFTSNCVAVAMLLSQQLIYFENNVAKRTVVLHVPPAANNKLTLLGRVCPQHEI